MKEKLDANKHSMKAMWLCGVFAVLAIVTDPEGILIVTRGPEEPAPTSVGIIGSNFGSRALFPVRTKMASASATAITRNVTETMFRRWRFQPAAAMIGFRLAKTSGEILGAISVLRTYGARWRRAVVISSRTTSMSRP